MAVVNEDFTADCMAYQFIVNPQQTRYYLEGQKQVMIAQKPAPIPQITEQIFAGAESDNDHAPKKETTRLDENSRISARLSPEPQEPSSFMQKPDLGERTGASRDALDEAIEEAKAVKDLVCSPRAPNHAITKANRVTSRLILTKTKVRHPTQPARNQTMPTVKRKRNQMPKNA